MSKWHISGFADEMSPELGIQLRGDTDRHGTGPGGIYFFQTVKLTSLN